MCGLARQNQEYLLVMGDIFLAFWIFTHASAVIG